MFSSRNKKNIATFGLGGGGVGGGGESTFSRAMNTQICHAVWSVFAEYLDSYAYKVFMADQNLPWPHVL